MLELKRDGHARVQTEMVEFIALPFSSSGLVISRSRVGNGENVQKSVMHLLHFDAVVAVAVESFVRSLNIPEIACKWQNHSFTWIKYDSQKVYQTKLNFEKTVRLTGHLRSVSIFFKVVHPFLFCCYYLYFFSSFFTHFSGGSLCLSFDKFWDTVPPRGGGGGEVIPGNSWWGCAARFSKSLPYCRPQNWHSPHSFSDLARKIHTLLSETVSS